MEKRIRKVGEFLTWSGMGVNAGKSHVMVVGGGGGPAPPLLIKSWDAMENKIKVGSIQDVGDAAVKVLGVHIDRHLKGNKLTEVLNAGLKKFCEAIMRRAKGWEQSALMVREILGARWAYYLPFATVPEAMLDEWDKKIRGAVKKRAGVVRSISNSALYTSWDKGGGEIFNAEAEYSAAQCAEWRFLLNGEGPVSALGRSFFSERCGTGIGEGHPRPVMAFWGNFHDRLLRAGGSLASWEQGWALKGNFGDKRVAEFLSFPRWVRRRKVVWLGDLVQDGHLMSLNQMRERFPAVGNTEWDLKREQGWYGEVERYWREEMKERLGERVGIKWGKPKEIKGGGLDLGGPGEVMWAFGDGSKNPSSAVSPVGWGVQICRNVRGTPGEVLWEEAGGVQSLGNKEKTNNFAEAQALLWALQNCDESTILFFWTDSQVVHDRWYKLERMGTRAWVSISDGGIWRAIDEARRKRISAGGTSEVYKCFSHVGDREDGKGAEQKEWVSMGNEAADFLANRGREGARGVREEAIRGFGMYGIFDGDGPVEGNVREWARKVFRDGEQERWALQSIQGKLVTLPMDPVAMAGMIEPSGAGHGTGEGGLAMKLRTDTLPVPKNLVLRDGAAEEKGIWTWEEAGVVCPLCEEEAGTAEHALGRCKCTREARSEGVRELDELLWGWGDIKEEQNLERLTIERGAHHGRFKVERERWENWKHCGRLKGFRGREADWVWGLEGHTIAPAWTVLIHKWLGVGPKKPPLTCGVMLGAQRNRSDLKGFFRWSLMP